MNRFDVKAYLTSLYGTSWNCNYLIIPGCKSPSSLVAKSRKIRTETIDEIEYVIIDCSRAFLKTLLAKDEVFHVYMLLNQYLTENDIRTYFYEVWRGWHNYMAMKANRRFIAETKTQTKAKGKQ